MTCDEAKILLAEYWSQALGVVHFETPDPACHFPIIHKPRDARLNAALSNSFGFGGTNGCLLLKKA